MSVEAFLSWGAAESASILQLKRYCNGALPAYMVPDRFKILPALPIPGAAAIARVTDGRGLGS